jgi:23S rRNA (adenine2503-C2)-methyltransferase
MNPVAHTPWQPSRADRIAAFAAALREAGVATTIRRNRGIEIGAACGQLAAEQATAPSPDAVMRRRSLLEAESSAALLEATR